MMDSADYASLNRAFERRLSELAAEFNNDGLSWLNVIYALEAEIQQIKDEELSANEHFVLNRYA